MRVYGSVVRKCNSGINFINLYIFIVLVRDRILNPCVALEKLKEERWEASAIL